MRFIIFVIFIMHDYIYMITCMAYNNYLLFYIIFLNSCTALRYVYQSYR